MTSTEPMTYKPGPELDAKYGMLTPIRYLGKDKHRQIKWLCRCDCGKVGEFNAYNIKSGATRSCGCQKNQKIHLDVQELKRLYIEERKSMQQIADMFGVHIMTVFRYLKPIGVTRTNSEAHAGLQAQENNPNWKGGRSIRNGYVVVRVGGKQVFEHRVIAAKMIGRELHEEEVVHHINGIKDDNRPENLMVLPSNSAHAKLHAEMKKAAALSTLQHVSEELDGG